MEVKANMHYIISSCCPRFYCRLLRQAHFDLLLSAVQYIAVHRSLRIYSNVNYLYHKQ